MNFFMEVRKNAAAARACFVGQGSLTAVNPKAPAFLSLRTGHCPPDLGLVVTRRRLQQTVLRTTIRGGWRQPRATHHIAAHQTAL